MRYAIVALVCGALQVSAKLPQAIYSNKTIATPAHNVFRVRDVLEPRQSCVAGPTCSDGGYCCSGDACCGYGGCIPGDDTCCSGGYGCQPGYYCCGDGCAPEDGDCCGDGGHCPSGDSCTQQNCDYDWCCAGPNQSYDYFSVPSLNVPSFSIPPVPSSTPASAAASVSSYGGQSSYGASPSGGGGVYQYYYTTFTFYFWVYFATTIQQTPTVTSTRTTTQTLISVYAPNQNAADQQFTSLESIAQSAASAAASISMPALPSSTSGGGAVPRMVGPAGAWVEIGGMWLGAVAGIVGILAVAL